GVAEALEYLLDLARRDGFETKNLDGYAGHVEYGEGEELIGVLGHVDVVPPGDGWTTPPFAPEIRDGKLYARGAIDDKGPTMAAYFALRLIKELGLPLSKRVRLILGTDEENLWRDMAYYFEREEMRPWALLPTRTSPSSTPRRGSSTSPSSATAPPRRGKPMRRPGCWPVGKRDTGSTWFPMAPGRCWRGAATSST